MGFSAVRTALASSNRTWLGAIRGRVPNPQPVKQAVKARTNGLLASSLGTSCSHRCQSPVGGYKASHKLGGALIKKHGVDVRVAFLRENHHCQLIAGVSRQIV